MRRKKERPEDIFLMDVIHPDYVMDEETHGYGEVWIYALSEDDAIKKYKECAKRHPELIFLDDAKPRDTKTFFGLGQMYEDLIEPYPESVKELNEYGCVPL